MGTRDKGFTLKHEEGNSEVEIDQSYVMGFGVRKNYFYVNVALFMQSVHYSYKNCTLCLERANISHIFA